MQAAVVDGISAKKHESDSKKETPNQTHQENSHSQEDNTPSVNENNKQSKFTAFLIHALIEFCSFLKSTATSTLLCYTVSAGLWAVFSVTIPLAILLPLGLGIYLTVYAHYQPVISNKIREWLSDSKKDENNLSEIPSNVSAGKKFWNGVVSVFAWTMSLAEGAAVLIAGLGFIQFLNTTFALQMSFAWALSLSLLFATAAFVASATFVRPSIERKYQLSNASSITKQMCDYATRSLDLEVNLKDCITENEYKAAKKIYNKWLKKQLDDRGLLENNTSCLLGRADDNLKSKINQLVGLKEADSVCETQFSQKVVHIKEEGRFDGPSLSLFGSDKSVLAVARNFQKAGEGSRGLNCPKEKKKVVDEKESHQKSRILRKNAELKNNSASSDNKTQGGKRKKLKFLF